MGVRRALTYDLVDRLTTQRSENDRSENERQYQPRHRRHDRAEGDISDEVEDAVLRNERDEEVVEQWDR